MTDRYQPLRDAIAETFDGEWHAPGLGEVHDEDHRVIAMCIDTDPVGPGESPFPSLAEGERIAGLIVAAVNTAPALLKERDALRDALQWYASMSKRMGNASIAGDSQAILALMKDVAVDYGGRARAALAAGDEA